LSSLDSAFLHLETPSAHFHIGGVATFEADGWGSPAERFEALLRHINVRLDQVPRFRQRIVRLPLNLDAPVWVDDHEFELGFHVRRAALPAPGGDLELCQFVEQVFSKPLDRRRPLWEIYCIEGLPDGRWALITKAHHCLADGLSVLALATLLLDADPEFDRSATRSRWTPDSRHGIVDVLVETARERASQPARLLRSAAAGEFNPIEATRTLLQGGGGLLNLLQNVRIEYSPINGATGPTRAYRYSRFQLSQFKAVKEAFDATVNDLVLGVVSGGLRHYLEGRGEDVDSIHLKAVCPVSLRAESQKASLGNELSMMLVPLSVEVESPVARMRWAKAHVGAAKRDQQAAGADMMRTIASSVPGPLHPILARSIGRLAGYNTLVTNIPGPQFPLYCMGCRMVEAMPVAFLYEGQHIAIAIFSYAGSINFGYIADGIAFADIDRLAQCMEKSFEELVAVARLVPEPDEATEDEAEAGLEAEGELALA
jgi:WS/DGAT/MGAT family acyltransferase